MGRPTNEEINDLKDRLDSLISTAENTLSHLQEKENTLVNAINEISSSLQSAQENKATIDSLHGDVSSIHDQIRGLMDASSADAANINELSDKTEKTKENIDINQSKLNEQIEKSDSLNKTIEGLLPGATSAGLASAFSDRKDSFVWPKRLWVVGFMVSIFALIGVAFFNPLTMSVEGLKNDNLISYFIARLPLIIPIVWFAIYSGRRHSQALRLEEDYAHKESLSKSFQGYKNQLLEIDDGKGDPELMLQLVIRTLEALAHHPDRIYSGRHEDITPFTPLQRMLRKKNSN